MATFTSFEEMESWKKSRELTRLIYSASNKGVFAKDFGLRDQIRRASVSIMSNIVEGFERAGTKEFIQLFSVAKGSAGEVRSQLHVALDQVYINEEEFKRLSALATEIGRMIGGLMKYLRTSKIKGSKFSQQ